VRRALFACGLLLGACSSAVVVPDGSAPADPAVVYALLANGHLVVVHLPRGATDEISLTTSAPDEQSEMHAMSLSRDGRMLYAAVADANLNGHVVEVDTASGRTVREIELPLGTSPRGLVVGPRTGNLYVFGVKGGSAVVWIIDPAARSPARTITARNADGHSYFVFQGLVSSDETALFLSYHGADTTGIDRYELKGDTIERCIADAPAGRGCFNAHGGMALLDDRLLATTGEGPLLALDPRSGRIVAQYDVQLPGNHIDDFGLDEYGQRAFIVGSCGYSGGLSVVDLRSARTTVLVPAREADPRCGERISVVPGGHTLVVAHTLRPVAAKERTGKLLVLAMNGRQVREIATSSEPIDIIVSRP
jgi:hypothetical protein